MYKNLLPIGTVVRTRGAERDLMICGRIVCRENEDKIYDYVGCVFPEGVAREDEMFFFDRDAIEKVSFIGFQDPEELAYRAEVLDLLGELAVVNGEIVPAREARGGTKKT